MGRRNRNDANKKRQGGTKKSTNNVDGTSGPAGVKGGGGPKERLPTNTTFALEETGGTGETGKQTKNAFGRDRCEGPGHPPERKKSLLGSDLYRAQKKIIKGGNDTRVGGTGPTWEKLRKVSRSCAAPGVG